MNNKPLAGVKVIEMSTYIAAPVSAKMLADWGAEVIKVEPANGDVYRYIGQTLRMPVTPEQNPCFDLENGNKKTISIDMRTEDGQKVLRKLLATANVLITNYRPEALKKLRLTYEELSEEFPSLVYGIVTGYGEEGPDKDKPGFDLTAFLARSGMMRDVADKNGPPMSIVPAIGDHTTGLALANGICAALYKQQATGQGDKVVAGLYQSALFVQSTVITGSYHGLSYPISHSTSPSPIVNTYKCKDGEWLLLSATNFATDWAKVCKVIGRPELIEDERYNTVMGMIKHTPEMTTILDEAFITKTRDEWEALCEQADIANEKVLHWKDVLEDEQAWANNYLREVEYANGEKSVLVNTPVTFNSVGTPDFTPAPAIGANTDEVLAEIGYTQEELDELREKKLIK